MPHPDYRYQAHILVACSGGAESAPTEDGPQGKFTSKSQTRLAYAVADATAWGVKFRASEESGSHDEINFHALLAEASRSELSDAISEAVERLDFYFDESKGGSLNLVFSGHGDVDGNLELNDGPLSPDELMEWCAAGRAGQQNKTRHLRMVIDSCYAGRSLARMLLHEAHWNKVVIRDGFAACLPSQQAFELDRLGHSVLTHTMLRPYAHVLPPSQGWSDDEIREVKRADRESTQYLTNGAQHAIDVLNGHFASLAKGTHEGVEIDPGMDLDKLSEALNDLGRKPRRKN